jgi:hypothetical protein
MQFSMVSVARLALQQTFFMLEIFFMLGTFETAEKLIST